MIVSNRIKRIFVLILSITITSPLFPAESAALPDEATIQQALRTEFEQILRGYRAAIKELNMVLESLLLLADNNAFKIKNKVAFVTNAKDVKDFITRILAEPFLNVAPEQLETLNVLSNGIINHINAALDNHMTDFPAFDIQQLLTRHKPREVTLESLYNDVNKTGEELKKLVVKSKSAGLRWHNKAYRFLDKTIIQPGNKYKVFSRAGKLGIAGLAALSVAFLSENDFWFRKRLGLGWPFKVMGDGNTLNMGYHNGPVDWVTGQPCDPHPLKWPGKFEFYVWQKMRGFGPISTFLVGLSYALWKDELATFKNHAGVKLNKLKNFFKGGTYAEKPESKFLLNPRVKFKDLIGLEHAKKELFNIVNYMKETDHFERAKIAPEKGYLLTGPTRTGKSYMAEALAGEIKALFKAQNKNPDDFKFFSITATEINAVGISAIMREAKAIAPCVLFIDEIDLLGLRRITGNPEMLSQFLNSMSGCLEADPDKVVIIIGATNRPQHLDHALRQPGRFGKEIRFEYPSFKDRKEFLTKKIGALANTNEFNIDQLARETEGISFEKLNSMIKVAFQHGITSSETLSQAVLEKSLDEEVRNLINKDETPPTKEEQKLLAVHQAGHALAVMLLDSQEKLAKVSTKKYLAHVADEMGWEPQQDEAQQQQKKIKYGKTYTYHEHDTKNFSTHADKMKQGKIALAGFAAEHIILGNSGYSYHQEDTGLALEIAKSIVTQGLEFAQLPKEVQDRYLTKALELKEQWAKEISALLSTHKDKLQALADELYTKQTLTGAEVAAITGLKSPYEGHDLTLKPCLDGNCTEHKDNDNKEAVSLAAA